MRTPARPALTLLLFTLAAGACNQPRTAGTASDTAATPRVDKQAEEQAIRDLSKRWEQMFAQRDSAGIAALYAEDGYALPPNTKAMKGPEEVRKGMGEMFRTVKDFKLTFAPAHIVIADAGDMAYEHGTWQASYTGPKGKKVEDRGNYVTVYKKVNGEWKVLADMNNSEIPAGTAGT